jgi:hypothetical protein
MVNADICRLRNMKTRLGSDRIDRVFPLSAAFSPRVTNYNSVPTIGGSRNFEAEFYVSYRE